MVPFKDSYILVEILFMHAAKGTQEIAQAGPDTFHGVVVDFANAVSILIPRPASLARRVPDRFMVTLRRRQMPIGPPFVGIDHRMGPGGVQHLGFQRFSGAIFDHLQAHLTGGSTDDAPYGRTVGVPGAMPALLIGPSTRWIVGVGMPFPFFSPHSDTVHRFLLPHRPRALYAAPERPGVEVDGAVSTTT